MDAGAFESERKDRSKNVDDKFYGRQPKRTLAHSLKRFLIEIDHVTSSGGTRAGKHVSGLINILWAQPPRAQPRATDPRYQFVRRCRLFTEAEAATVLDSATQLSSVIHRVVSAALLDTS